MPTIDIPFFGNLVLCLVLVSAAYTFAVAVGAGRGRPQLLVSARWGTYATCALVGLGVLLLAYAFQTHDFRIRYVARYSDRSMPWWYLVTSLWGGQDGSLLWWSFLLAGYTGATTRWMRGRYYELQPWVIATLMSIFLFFVVLMLFAANPFATFPAAAPPDGEGLNPLLQNYWMTIHPPSLYMGFVGWAVPFAFCIAALATGRLTDEWLKAARVWAMIAWLFLSIGLLLGCLWSYEELGWGGYWAWDPVENASFMPWLVGTAYLHSVVVQERYAMLKVWNVFLMCLTFFMTIFGTFLTRSGLIASVHSFARSDIGIFFAWYLLFLLLACAALIIWRLPKLKAEHQLQALLSREFAFLLNNWILLAMMFAVLAFTTWPLISDWVFGQEATVGPDFYNSWMPTIGLLLLLLTGIGPLISWRKATAKNLLRACLWPAAAGLVMLVVHLSAGDAIGFPPVVAGERIYPSTVGKMLGAFRSVLPLVMTVSCAFVIGCILQEFWRGARVRMRSKKESVFTALYHLVGRARRRYGGYIVHIGIVLMYLGFTGAAWDTEDEAALHPGDHIEVAGHRLRYDGPRMEVDPEKRAVFADMSLMGPGDEVIDEVHPAKFIYRKSPEMPTTEVAIRSRIKEDIYVIMSTADPQTKRATVRVVVRPLVMWIWLGGIVLIFGALICIVPSTKDVLASLERRDRRRGPGGGDGPGSGGGGSGKNRKKPPGGSGGKAAATALLLALALPGVVHAQSSTLHAGSVVIKDPAERELFSQLLCQCGDCQRLPLDTCACSWAENQRAEIRARMANGADPMDIIATFRGQFGPAAISIPADEGAGRALWAVPISLAVVAVGVVVWVGRRWRRAGYAAPSKSDAPDAEPVMSAQADEKYDQQLEDELARLEDDR